MTPTTVSRITMALLLVVVLVGGIVLGSAVAAFAERTPAPTPTAVPTPGPSEDVPAADVDGEDLGRLPRFPGSVRTEFEISVDESYRLTAVEYVVRGDIEVVRAFYEDVIDEHDWEPADVTYTAGEWAYVLVDGRLEALVELEVWRGLVEIDLQVSEPIEPPAENGPSPTSQPATRPPSPSPDDDDDDDDDGPDDDDDDDDDGGGNQGPGGNSGPGGDATDTDETDG